MKKGLIILSLVIFLVASSFAQNAPKIQRAYAFYTMSTPGIAMADEKGNTINPPPIIERFMYVECPGTKPPEIRYAAYNKVEYNSTITKVNERVIHVGKKEAGGKDVVLTAGKGNSFWKLDLQLTADSPKAPKEVSSIYIYGRSNKRGYNFHLYTETRLMTPDRY